MIADGAPEAYAPTVAGASSPGADEHAAMGPGQALGRYEILDVLGEGGMGRVYAAHDPVLDRKVALKVLRPGQRVSADARARLLREARAMAKLNHPNVITVYEVGSVEEIDFVAMELIEGETLAAWLARGPRPWREVAKVMLDAGRGLAAAHGAGLVHRDFKPANVLIDKRGRVVVTDFGLARSVRAARSQPRDASDRAGEGTSEPVAHEDAGDGPDIRPSWLETLTEAGAVMGTPAYMAPEQHVGSEPDERTDQFGYCVVLWEGLYGKRPFVGKSLEELRVRVFAGKLAPPPSRKAIPRRLRRAVRRGLQPAPSDRYPSMEALLGELEWALSQRRRQAVAISAAVGMVAVSGAVVVAGGGSPSAPRCGDAGDQLAGIWDEEIEAQVRRAFAKAGAIAGSSLATAVDHLDDYASAWRESYDGLCEATYERGEMSEDDYHLARRCLARRRSELGSLVQVFRDADASTTERAAMAAQGLPRLEDCEDLESLRAGIAPPRDEDVRRAVDDVRDELAALRALWEAGRAGEAEARAEAAVERARDIGYAPLVAEALYQKGEIHIQLAGVSAAREALEEAEFLAEVEGHDEVRARALVARVDAETRFSSDHEAILRIAERARAVADREGRDARLHARMDRALARIYREESRDEEAEAALDAALARYRTEEGPRSVRAAETKGELADLYGDLGRFEEALEHGQDAVSIAVETLGGDHPLVVERTVAVARVLQALGRYDEARARYDAIEGTIRSARGHAEAGAVREVRGRVVDARGEPIENAEVAIGTRIDGDGKSAYGYRGLGGASSRTRRTVTDRHGRFALAALEAPLVAIAEHDEHGRSMPVPIPAGDGDLDELDLQLAPFGRVEGTLHVHGEPPPVIEVAARPRVDLNGAQNLNRVRVRSGEAFAFDRLAAGPHLLAASAVWGHSEVGSEEKLVLVRPGETVRLDLSLEREGHELEVDVRGPRGEAIPSAQVLLLLGRRDYGYVRDIEQALLQSSEVLTKAAFAFPARPAELAGVSAGQYTLCAVPMPVDIKDTEMMDELDPHRGAVPVYCEPLVVGGAGAERAITVEVPDVPALDELIDRANGR